ncbi:hypothetical protein FLAVO9AF_750028 [Flavobacterium sp. 9AF]|uniref:DUF6443 domain-containing protein n=1 Tax=Flavobacterium sp. 9AF TaxID=2653142 RepID=UPI0012F02CA1|nr:DUF6443 domain-containing protein [Flavobacterium sp. 9AF]VXC27041.1 hypothetical protein FLAVO9AF_750028 [Flavobacterium sp. 9AF]
MKIKFLIVLGLVCNIVFSQLSTDKNYVHVKTYKRAVNENIVSTDDNDFDEDITYLDGSGKQKQTILIKAGGNNEDIIFNNEYDALKRKPKAYLPYAKDNNAGAYESNFNAVQSAFYNTTKYENTLNPYNEKVYDEDDLGFVSEISDPGNDWELSEGRTKKQNYKLYNYQGVEDSVYKYAVDLTNPNSPVLVYSGGIYDSKTLVKYIYKNENWIASDNKDNTTEVYKDKRGRVILKRLFENNIAHDTYYVYDIQGNVAFIIPPVVNHNDLFDSNDNPTPNQVSVLEKFCFQYKYDSKNRQIEKRLPSKGWEYLVYDKLNRAILSQDANLRNGSSRWNFVEYDALGRIVYEGVLTDINNYTREQIQSVVEGLNTYVYYDGLAPFNFSHYLDQFSLDVNSVNYYDDYLFNLDGINVSESNLYNVKMNMYTKGLLTGNKVRILNTNEWETNVYMYDEKERAVKVISKNQTLESLNTVDFKLSFSGVVLEKTSTHSKTNVVTNLVTVDEYSYDKNERLIKHQQIINNKPKELISALRYDELGKLQEKKVGGTTKINITGLVESEGLITKTGSTNSWTNATIESVDKIKEDGKLSFKIRSTSGYLKMGLSYSPASTLHTQINYALSFSNTGILRVLESGTLMFSSTYTLNDFFEIETIANQVYYKRNGIIIYTSTVATTGELYVDSHFYINNSSLSNVSIENYSYENINPLQTIDFNYNIKGELTKINDVNNLGNDLFALEIKRNNPTSTGTPLYNGNVSQAYWKTANDNQLRYYDYNYDNLNRIKSAKFHNIDDSLQNDSFSLHTVNYDENGNITFLHRAGNKMNDPNLEWMDFMTYSYDGNQLTRVLEQGHGYFGHITQVEQTDTNPQYEYDANGNLTKDRNKAIANISYNHLDLPEVITFEGTTTKTITYVYDASGKKLEKVVNNNGSITITEYGNGYIYKKVNSNPTTLEYIQQAEGYIAHNNGVYSYVYNHTDHLGNIRITYSDSNNDGTVTTSEIIEENNYFPFGMKHQGYNNVYNILNGNSLAQNFKFGNKEYEENFSLNLYDFGARNYDAATGRWFGIDGLSEKYNSTSTYVYALNNPVYYVDLDGFEPTPYEAAIMASHVYGDNVTLVGGWKVSNLQKAIHYSSGLDGALYERNINGYVEYAYVYAGTTNMSDWKTNGNQVFGTSLQYEQVSKNVEKLDKFFKGKELTFVGHSLGGGLSNFSSLLTGRSSITFNPAWISKKTAQKYLNKIVPLKLGNSVRNFVHEKDPLNKLQNTLEARAIGLLHYGEDFKIKAGDFWDSIINGHFIGEMIDSLEDNGQNGYMDKDGSLIYDMRDDPTQQEVDDKRRDTDDYDPCNCYNGWN